ncbi:MAG: DASS family sodium-coupled anion symporter [Mariprofundaceae bacterium]
MPVSIDHRPIHVLLAHRVTPYVGMFLVAWIAYQTMQHQPAAGLTVEGWRALGVFGVCLVLWVTQLVPLAVTSLLGLALLPLLGVLPAADAYRLFGSPAVFFILGAFILAAGVMKTQLSEHMALAFLERVGLGPKRLILAVLLFPAFLAFWMPEHAVAAMFLPIVLEIVRSLGLERGHPYAAALFLAMAWGCVIGGVATLLGGARGPLAMGILQEISGRELNFVDWSMAAMPLVLLMLTVAVVVLLFFLPKVDIDIGRVRERLHVRRLEQGALGVKGRMMAVVMLAAVASWVFLGHALGLASIALLSVVLMFALRLVTWRDVEEYVNWGVVLMYGGAIAVGKALSVTGAAAWLAQMLLPVGLSPIILIVLLAGVTLLLTETVSNAAAVAILLPIAIPLGIEAGLDVMLVTLTVAIVAGFAFMLPMGTPANALIYSTHYVRLGLMVRRGVLMSLAAWALLVFTASVIWPMFRPELALHL